jgi:hypothetical protein
LYLHVIDDHGPYLAQVNVIHLHQLQLFDLRRVRFYLLSQLQRGRASIGTIVFDPKVTVGAARVVACREKDATSRTTRTDKAGDSRGGKEPMLANAKPFHTISSCNLDEHLDGFLVIEPSIATDD